MSICYLTEPTGPPEPALLFVDDRFSVPRVACMTPPIRSDLALSPRVRHMLENTGTVTSYLSTLFGEPVKVSKIRSLQAGSMLSRCVVLHGASTGRQFGFALAEIDLVPELEQLVHMVEDEGHGIGEALNILALPQVRQIEGIWLEDERPFDALFCPVRSGGFYARAYRIAIGEKPLIRIIERFAVSAFVDLHTAAARV